MNCQFKQMRGDAPGMQGFRKAEQIAAVGIHVHDLHATRLRFCGIDHKRLTYRYQGRDFRLTDVFGKVAEGIFV